MSVANLEAYAMSQGITKAYNAMTQAEQATLRYNYLLSTTAGAQGDFARTSESYSNQVKLFQENVNTIMAQAGQVVIDIINPVLQTINEALADLTKETVEEQIAGVEKSEKEEIIEADKKKARADTLIDTLDELSKKTELSEYETKLWESALQELVATFPELAEHIDLANGSIKTSTDEIRKNTEEAWTNAREKAKINALNAKEQVRANALQAAADAEIELAVARAEADELKKESEAANKAFFDWTSARNEAIAQAEAGTHPLGYSSWEVRELQYPEWQMPTVDPEIQEKYFEAEKAITPLQEAYDKAMESYSKANEAYVETAEKMDGIILKHEQEEAATQAATEAQEAYTDALKDETEAFKTLSDAWDAVAEHREETYGKMRDSLRNGTNDLWGVVADMTEIDINKSMETAQANMIKNMAFYAEYAANLRNAQRAGVNEGLLAELAKEQTAENYALLEYLFTQANPQEINQLNESWKHLQAAKDDLATTMTDTQLAVDEGYAALVDTAEEAVDQLNQYETARLNAKETGTGVVDGLGEVIPDIEKKVEEINAIIGLVGSTPISLEFGMSASGSAGMIQSAVADGAREGVRSGLSGVRIPLEVRGLTSALAPGISYAIQQAAVQGRYSK